jgi:hypothetical protein
MCLKCLTLHKQTSCAWLWTQQQQCHLVRHRHDGEWFYQWFPRPSPFLVILKLKTFMRLTTSNIHHQWQSATNRLCLPFQCVPPSISPLLVTTWLLTLDKQVENIGPITIGKMIYQLVICKLAIQFTNTFAKYFSPHQFGVATPRRVRQWFMG